MLFKKPKTFIDEVHALKKGEDGDIELIWRSFEGENSQQNISYFCQQLFEFILNSQKKSYLLQNQQRLYATLLCMELYKNKKQKKQSVLLECNNYIEKKTSSHGKGFMQYLFSNERESQLCEFFIRRLVLIPKQFDQNFPISYQLQKQMRQAQQYRHRLKQGQLNKSYQNIKNNYVSENQNYQTKLISFGYLCFINHIKNNNYQIKRYEYQVMIKIGKILMNGIKQLILVQEQLCLLLHLIIICIRFYGCQYEEILKELMMWTNQIRNFMGKVGVLGEQLFNVVYGELKIPGTEFRKQLKKDFICLGIKDNALLNKDIYFVYSSEDFFHYHEVLSLSTLRKLIIWQLLTVSTNDESKLKEYKKYIKHLNNDATYLLYDKYMRVLDLIQKMDNVVDVKSYLKEFVSKLMNNSINCQQNMVRQGESCQAKEFQIRANRTNKFGFFQYPKCSVISIPINDFVSNKEGPLNLAKIIQRNKIQIKGKASLRNKIPLVFSGDGQNLIKLIKYIAEYQQRVQIDKLKLFQIYYIPKQQTTNRSGIGQYIAHKDPWYRKFVFNVFGNKMLYPHLQINNWNKDLFPFYLRKKNVELYLRDAHHNMPIRVYKCWLKMNEFQTEESLFMISFLRIGLFCEAQIIKMTKEKEKGKQERYSHKQLLQIIESKVKKMPAITLSLQIQYIEPITGEIKKKRQQSLKIEDLQICNIPHEYFMGRQPNPIGKNLQMTILTQNNGKIFRKQLSHSEHFKIKDGRGEKQIFNSFKDLFICQTIRNYNNSFRLMIDGNVANRIQKIRIQPAYSNSGLPITIPFQCFMPFT